MSKDSSTVRSVHTPTSTTPLRPISTVAGTVYLKLETANQTGSVHDREAPPLMLALASSGARQCSIHGSAPLCLAAASAAAQAVIATHVHLDARPPETIAAELHWYGARFTVGQNATSPSDLRPFDAQRITGFSAIPAELQQQLGCPPAAVFLPAGLPLLEAGLLAGFGAQRPRLQSVPVPSPNATSLATARDIARRTGLLLGPSAIAALAALPTEPISGPIVILDCFAPKFYHRYLAVSPAESEEGKLGGLIIPR